MIIRRSETKADFRCIFICNENLEMLNSLHIMSDPNHHITCADWIKKKHEALRPELQKQIDDFGRKYAGWSFIADIVSNIVIYSDKDNLSVPEMLSEMKKIPANEFAYQFLGLSAFQFDRSELNQWIENPEIVTASLLREQASFFEVETVIAFLQDIEAVQKQTVQMLDAYWKESFSYSWEKIKAYEESVMHKEQLLFDRTEPIEYLKKLHPNVTVHENRLVFQKDPDFSIAVSDIKELAILLSVFSGPHLFANIFDNTVSVTMNLDFRSIQLQTDIPRELLSLFTAISDETRLRMMKILWNGDATTKEIAQLLELSASNISLHLKVLREADLVETRKVKKYVYYRLKQPPFFNIQELLLQYFEE